VGSAYTIMQLNLCLSGLAECYEAVAYPAGVDNAVARIRETGADAVTITEACRHDAESMAARLGYDSRFARVRYGGGALHCVNPKGRGIFGIAILTRSPIVKTATRTFAAQYGPEQRRWMCATTRRGVDVCAAHLETPYTSAAVAARDAQCAELADVLAHQRSRAIVFGGDVNRQGSCAPRGAWERADDAADQAPGIQQVYGSGDLGDPTADVLPSTFSDHDMLVVHARLTPR
jgi:endonuclease/exonuclease/phosphatase family metal-dependent hydrolase